MAKWGSRWYVLGWFHAACCLAFAWTAASAQTSPPTGLPPGEVSTREAPLTFKTKVNLVSIPVVARDAQDHAVGSFTREDFALTDNGRPQTISRFSVEKFGETAAAAVPPPSATATPILVPAPVSPPAMPERYVAYLFDDINTPFSQMAQAREAAFRHIANALRPAERAAVYTTSGEGGIDFTNDRDKLHKALLAIRPQNPLTQSSDCPPLSIYQAAAIFRGDVMALGAAEADYHQCALRPDAEPPSDTEWQVRNAARALLALADRNIGTFLATFDGVIRKLSVMAGQRTIVLVTSGFVMLDDRREEETAVLERALRAGVVVNALDARALQALAPGLDASAHAIDTAVSLPALGAPLSGGSGGGSGGSSLNIKMQEGREEEMVKRDILAEAAAASGGRLFENSNDLQGGFARLATAPEYIYVLGFAPQNLKLDGKYHSLKVSLRNSKGITLETRRGYYAPRYANDAGEQSKEEIEEAFFSRDETNDIPVAMQTQFYKTGEDQATVTVAAKIDIRQLAFRKDEGKNRNDLTVVAGLFDSDGNYLTGSQKVVEMRLLDETLQKRLASGITVRNTFNIAPGTYFVRLVVRDAEGQRLTAHGGTVEVH